MESSPGQQTNPSPVEHASRHQYEDLLDMREAESIARHEQKMAALRSAIPDVRAKYHGAEYRVVLGPPVMVEQRNGALMSTGMPTINLADPVTGDLHFGLTFDIPEAPLKPNQVLVGGREEGLRALTEAGVVRHTGEFYRSREYDATFAVCDFLGLPERHETTLAELLEATIGKQAAQKEKERDDGLER